MMFKDAIKVLSRIQATNKATNEDLLDDGGLLAMDAIRGSLAEEKWRGTLLEAFENGTQPGPLARRALERIELLRGCDTPGDPPAGDIPPFGIGTYGWKYDPAVIHAALDAGAQLIDTAEGYGFGKVEKALGEALAGRDAFVATKVARSHMRPTAVFNAAQRSKKRLGGKPLSLYQVHWPA